MLLYTTVAIPFDSRVDSSPPRPLISMPLFEVVCNLHMHTPYSDGEWYHAAIAQAALRAGLDCICVTDHNIWVKGPERYYEKDHQR